MSKHLEERVARQFSSLYLTLVSVLVGVALADLFSEIHDRMTLWPLTIETGRTWLQIFGAFGAVLSAWVSYAHLGLLRKRLPTIWDTVDASMVLVTIPLNAATGRVEAAAWFLWAGIYCLAAVIAIGINVKQSTREVGLTHLPRLMRFGGPFTLAYLGGPGFLGMAWASSQNLTTPLIELFATAAAPIASTLVPIFFMREWRIAVLHESTPPTKRRA